MYICSCVHACMCGCICICVHACVSSGDISVLFEGEVYGKSSEMEKLLRPCLSNMPLTEINYWFITVTVDTGHDPGVLRVTRQVQETQVEEASAQQD